MARHRRLHVLNEVHRISMVPLFYHENPEIAIGLVQACVKGGAKVVEFTNRGPAALSVFSQVEDWCSKNLPEAILGIGSVIDAPTAALFTDAGANFIVSPCFDEDTAIFCNKHKLPYMPGCGTVTEIHKAESMGVEVCKLFPGEAVGGPGFVKGVLAPRPWSSLMPTGGVAPTEDSLRSWFDAGIVCAGMGSKLITKDIMQNKDFDTLTSNVKSTLDLIQSIKEN